MSFQYRVGRLSWLSLVYYAALRKAGVPTELHVYAKGGHAFGLRRTDPITGWPELVETWLGTITK